MVLRALDPGGVGCGVPPVSCLGSGRVGAGRPASYVTCVTGVSYIRRTVLEDRTLYLHPGSWTFPREPLPYFALYYLLL